MNYWKRSVTILESYGVKADIPMCNYKNNNLPFNGNKSTDPHYLLHVYFQPKMANVFLIQLLIKH